MLTGSTQEPLRDTRAMLSDAGIDKKLSSQAQRLVAVPEVIVLLRRQTSQHHGNLL